MPTHVAAPVRDRGADGACPGRSLPPSGRRCRTGPRGGAAGTVPPYELLSSQGVAHFRIGLCGVWRPHGGPGGPQVSPEGCLPGPARAEELGSGWAAGPGGGGAPQRRAWTALITQAAQAAGSGLGPIPGPRAAGETPAGLSGVPAPFIPSRGRSAFLKVDPWADSRSRRRLS